MTVARTSQLFDIGDPDAPVGSPLWCRAALERIRELKRQSQDAVSSLKYRLLSFAKDQYFTQLTDRDGVFFLTWQDFVQYPEPYGLGMRAEVVDAIMRETDDCRLLRDVIDSVPVAKTHAEAGSLGGRGKKAGVKHTGFSRGSGNTNTIIARLKRDRPDIAARLAAGEFEFRGRPSARAAAKAAGIKVGPTPLQELRRAWKRANAQERATFLREATQECSS